MVASMVACGRRETAIFSTVNQQSTIQKYKVAGLIDREWTSPKDAECICLYNYMIPYVMYRTSVYIYKEHSDFPETT